MCVCGRERDRACVCLCVKERERERERAREMENEKERDISQDQAVALSARCDRLGRRVHCSVHIMFSRALNLCAVFRSEEHTSELQSR